MNTRHNGLTVCCAQPLIFQHVAADRSRNLPELEWTKICTCHLFLRKTLERLPY